MFATLSPSMARAQVPPQTSSLYPAVGLTQTQLTSLLSAALGPSAPKTSTAHPHIHVVSLQSLPFSINPVYSRGNTVSDAPSSTMSSGLADSGHTKTADKPLKAHATSRSEIAKQCAAFIEPKKGGTRQCGNKTKTIISMNALRNLDVSAYRCHRHVDQGAETTAKLKKGSTITLANNNAHPCGAFVKVKGEKDRIRPCMNQTSKPLPLDSFLDPDTVYEPVEYRCYIHMVPKDKKIISRKNENLIIDLSQYIPSHLSDPTQCALRQKMAAAPTEADRPGYVYVFRIDDKSTPDLLHIKVGFTTDLSTRLNAWRKQCTSREGVILGCWPSPKEPSSRLYAEIRGGPEKILFVRRAEHLIHLELADIACHHPIVGSCALPPKGRPLARHATGALSGVLCPCGKKHQEIFTFQRAIEGELKDREYELVIRPVIEKWVKFVQEHMA